VTQSSDPWTVDVDDPRAPPLDVWQRMTPTERDQVLASLPSEFEVSEAAPPEGDSHFKAKMNTRKTLGRFFDRLGRRVYLACELPVYYPDERIFAPDLMAVLDVSTHERPHWVVSHEGKGLDLALEINQLELRLSSAEQRVLEEARLRQEEARLRQEEARLRQEEARLRQEEARLRQEEAERRVEPSDGSSARSRNWSG
jgi:Putative restriction endonuclease